MRCDLYSGKIGLSPNLRLENENKTPPLHTARFISIHNNAVFLHIPVQIHVSTKTEILSTNKARFKFGNTNIYKTSRDWINGKAKNIAKLFALR